MKKIAPMDLPLKPRMAVKDAEALAEQIKGAPGIALFHVRMTSGGYVPVAGAQRLEIALAAATPVTVQDIDSGESFEVKLNLNGAIVRA